MKKLWSHKLKIVVGKIKNRVSNKGLKRKGHKNIGKCAKIKDEKERGVGGKKGC